MGDRLGTPGAVDNFFLLIHPPPPPFVVVVFSPPLQFIYEQTNVLILFLKIVFSFCLSLYSMSVMMVCVDVCRGVGVWGAFVCVW